MRDIDAAQIKSYLGFFKRGHNKTNKHPIIIDRQEVIYPGRSEPVNFSSRVNGGRGPPSGLLLSLNQINLNRQ